MGGVGDQFAESDFPKSEVSLLDFHRKNVSEVWCWVAEVLSEGEGGLVPLKYLTGNVDWSL